MKTFEIEGNTYALNEEGKLLKKVQVLPGTSWGGSAFIEATCNELKNEDLGDRKLSFENFPKIPLADILFVRSFFKSVYDQDQSEAFVFFCLEGTEYTVIVPDSQETTGAHVKFNPNVSHYCTSCRVGVDNDEEVPKLCAICEGTEFKRASIVGTCHSHADMAAFHSPTDDENELSVTGFHITLGKMKGDVMEICPSYVLASPEFQNKDGDGVRFAGDDFPLEDLVDIPFPQETSFVRHWLSLVVSKMALGRLHVKARILVVDGVLKNISQDEGLYGRLVDRYGPENAKVLTATEYDDLKKLQTTKTSQSYNTGYGQSNVPVVTNTKSTPKDSVTPENSDKGGSTPKNQTSGGTYNPKTNLRVQTKLGVILKEIEMSPKYQMLIGDAGVLEVRVIGVKFGAMFPIREVLGSTQGNHVAKYLALKLLFHEVLEDTVKSIKAYTNWQIIEAVKILSELQDAFESILGSSDPSGDLYLYGSDNDKDCVWDRYVEKAKSFSLELDKEKPTLSEVLATAVGCIWMLQEAVMGCEISGVIPRNESEELLKKSLLASAELFSRSISLIDQDKPPKDLGVRQLVQSK